MSDRAPPGRPRAAPVANAIPLGLRVHGGMPRTVLLLCLIGTIVLGLFACATCRAGPSGSVMRRRCGPCNVRPRAWDDAMAALGLTRPHQMLRAAVARWQETGWGTE